MELWCPAFKLRLLLGAAIILIIGCRQAQGLRCHVCSYAESQSNGFADTCRDKLRYCDTLREAAEATEALEEVSITRRRSNEAKERFINSTEHKYRNEYGYNATICARSAGHRVDGQPRIFHTCIPTFTLVRERAPYCIGGGGRFDLACICNEDMCNSSPVLAIATRYIWRASLECLFNIEDESCK